MEGFYKYGRVSWPWKSCISIEKFHEHGKVPQVWKGFMGKKMLHEHEKVPELGKSLLKSNFFKKNALTRFKIAATHFKN